MQWMLEFVELYVSPCFV